MRSYRERRLEGEKIGRAREDGRGTKKIGMGSNFKKTIDRIVRIERPSAEGRYTAGQKNLQ